MYFYKILKQFFNVKICNRHNTYIKNTNVEKYSFNDDNSILYCRQRPEDLVHF